MAKETYIRVRIETVDKELIKEASEISTDGNLSKFMIDASTAKAKRVLAKFKQDA